MFSIVNLALSEKL